MRKIWCAPHRIVSIELRSIKFRSFGAAFYTDCFKEKPWHVFSHLPLPHLPPLPLILISGGTSQVLQRQEGQAFGLAQKVDPRQETRSHVIREERQIQEGADEDAQMARQNVRRQGLRLHADHELWAFSTMNSIKKLRVMSLRDVSRWLCYPCHWDSSNHYLLFTFRAHYIVSH